MTSTGRPQQVSGSAADIQYPVPAPQFGKLDHLVVDGVQPEHPVRHVVERRQELPAQARNVVTLGTRLRQFFGHVVILTAPGAADLYRYAASMGRFDGADRKKGARRGRAGDVLDAAGTRRTARGDQAAGPQLGEHRYLRGTRHDFPGLAYFPTAGGLLRTGRRSWSIEAGALFVVAPGDVMGHITATDLAQAHGWGVFFTADAFGPDVPGAHLAWRTHPLLFPFVRGGAIGALRLRCPSRSSPIGPLASKHFTTS